MAAKVKGSEYGCELSKKVAAVWVFAKVKPAGRLVIGWAKPVTISSRNPNADKGGEGADEGVSFSKDV